MKHRTILSYIRLVLSVLLLSSVCEPIPAYADGEPPVTHALVMEAFRLLPEQCTLAPSPPKGCSRLPAGFERKEEADAFATAIAHDARDLSEVLAAVQTVAYESGVNSHAKGDHNALTGEPQSYGGYQLSVLRVPPEDAMDIEVSTTVWLALYRNSLALCEKNLPEERMAAVYSGNCAYRGGRKLSRTRMAGLAALGAQIRARHAAPELVAGALSAE